MTTDTPAMRPTADDGLAARALISRPPIFGQITKLEW